jgi:hypothetical protein
VCVKEGCALLGRGGRGGGRDESVRGRGRIDQYIDTRYSPRRRSVEAGDSREGERGGGGPGLSCCGSKSGGVCDIE